MQNANIQPSEYDDADKNYRDFWASKASRHISWDAPWHDVLDWSNPPFAKWFIGGKLNACYNCVDRHVEAGNGAKDAIIWISESGERMPISYFELKEQVCKVANALQELGITSGDRVVIYLPMIPEAVYAMLACARIGAIHSVIFAGFSVDSVHSRIKDTEAKLVITADAGYRKNKLIPLKDVVDESIKDAESVESVLVVKRANTSVAWNKKIDHWWSDVVDRQSVDHEYKVMDAEAPLFILYTSGTTGKPKGILHTTGGYLTQVAYTHYAVFDIKRESDVYWCTADIGWITGHSYVVYGPLLNGCTQVIYEGAPDYPNTSRVWDIIDQNKVTILYTAPTLIRTFMKWGNDTMCGRDLSSLRLLGSVGEPINPEAWLWYHSIVGQKRCPIVDTWWQTETGAIMIAPLPGLTECKPGSATKPIPGISAEVVSVTGRKLPKEKKGLLAISRPWPSMARTIWGDDQRYIKTYWEKFDKKKYLVGDSAVLDEDSDFWILGRVDDTVNISGHLLSTAEVESALITHPAVVESAVVGAYDETTGHRIVAFVVLHDDILSPHNLEKALIEHIAKHIGPIAKPKNIFVVKDLPKTRSGKIMRRLLRDIVSGNDIGEITTLANIEEFMQIKLDLAQNISTLPG